MESRSFKVGRWQVRQAELRLVSEQNNEQKTLPPKVFEVLMQLIDGPEQTVSRQQLIDRIWQGNSAVGSRGITNAIYQLRKLFGEEDGEAIRTIAKTGYQLLLPVTELADAPQPTPVRIEQPATVNSSNTIPSWFQPAALIIIAVTSLALLTLQWLKPEAPASKRLQRVEPLTFLDGIEDSPAMSHSGRYLAFVWHRHNHGGQIFIKDTEDSDAPLRQISYSQGTENFPVWSPDDSAIAFARRSADDRCQVFIKQLDDLSQRKISNCTYHPAQRNIDWSYDGSTIAVIDHPRDQQETAVFAQPVDGGERQQVTFPPSGALHTQVTYANHSNQFAYIQQIGNQQDLFVVDESGRSRQLTFKGAPIYGVSWYDNDQHLLINSMRDGKYSVWQVAVATGQVSLFHHDAAVVNIATNPANDKMLLISQQHLKERLRTLPLNGEGDGQVVVDSHGRDLYGRYSPVAEQIIYLSDRSGQFEIWLSEVDGSGARQLTDNVGLPNLPQWSPTDSRYAVPIQHANGKHGDLYLGNAQSGELIRLTNDRYEYHHVSWSRDGQSLYFSSNRSGRWELWQYRIATKGFTQVTDHDGNFMQEGEDGERYFTRRGIDGLWRLTDDEPELVLQGLAYSDWGNWRIRGDDVYFVNRSGSQDHLQRLNLVTEKQQQLLSLPRGTIRRNGGISMIDDQQILLTVSEHRSGDIFALHF